MSKIKYFILNDDLVIGTFWETKELGSVLVLRGSVNFDFPIEVYSKDEEMVIEKVDIIEELMEILNFPKLDKEPDE